MLWTLNGIGHEECALLCLAQFQVQVVLGDNNCHRDDRRQHNAICPGKGVLWIWVMVLESLPERSGMVSCIMEVGGSKNWEIRKYVDKTEASHFAGIGNLWMGVEDLSSLAVLCWALATNCLDFLGKYWGNQWKAQEKTIRGKRMINNCWIYGADTICDLSSI